MVDTISGCAPFTVKIKESSTGEPTQYFWDFGNGQTSTLRTPNVIYTKPGVYTLTETITSGTSQSATFTTIYVRGIPATFIYTYEDVCKIPSTIHFTADSIDNTAKYHWSFGDNNKSIENSPDNMYTIAGKYNVQLATESAQGCKDTTMQQIQIGKGDADFLLPTTACMGQPVLLINNSLPLPKTTTWTVDNTTLTGTNTEFTFNKTGSFTIKMNADFGTCKQAVTKQVNVLSSPKAAYTEAGTLVSCTYPVTVTFTNNSSNASSYKWLFGDGETATTQNATHTFSNAGMFNVSLVAFNANGCADTLTKPALVKLGPPVITSFSNLPTSGCIPVTAKPKANISSPEAIVAYDWDFGDGTHAFVAEPTHVYTTAGYYRVTLTVKTASGCTGTYSMFQAVAGGAFLPVVNFSVPDTNVCGTSPLQFTASISAGTVTSWNWDFGDGTKSSVQNPVHQYSAAGSYTVTLYVSDKGCPSNVQKKNYILVKPPIAKIQPVYYCDDRLKVDFLDQSIQPASWEWDFGDGSSSKNQNDTHTYSKSGQYHVTLTTSNKDCKSIADTIVSIIDYKPTITLTPASGMICRNDSIHINTDNTDYISDYLWNLGDGTTIFGNSSIQYAYKKTGTYLPYLIINYVNGCKDTSTLASSIHVFGPTAGFSNPATACLNEVVNFSDISHTDGTHTIKTWQWNDGNGEVIQQTAAAFSHTYKTDGTYTPTLKVTDTFGCTDSVAAVTPITVNGAAATFDFTATQSGCSAVLYTFTNQSSTSNDEIKQYKWSFGDGDSAFVKDPQHTYNHTLTAGQVSLIVETASGCADTAVKTITANVDNAFKTVMNAPASVCLHEPVHFSATEAGEAGTTKWLWDFGNGKVSEEQNTTYTYDTAAVYTVKLIAYAGNTACTDTITQPITVNPLPAVNAGKAVLVCAGKSINLTVTGAYTYSWQPTEYLSCFDCTTPVASPLHTTKYYVRGTDNNGCTNNDSVEVTVQQPIQLLLDKTNINLCAGDAAVLNASGADVYNWEPAAGLNNPVIATPVAKPAATTSYTVTASDKNQCFTSSEQVNIIVNNKPAFDITNTLLTLNKGAVQQLQTSSSADVVSWLWQPQQGLSCYNCAAPKLTANQSTVYTATATTAAGCSAADKIRIVILCDNATLYIPSAFTPNRDGKNDRFYLLSVNGTLQKIKSFNIYSSTGQRVFSKQNIYANNYADGWDGSYKGNLLNGNTFIYTVEVDCNNKIIPVRGTVILIR